MQEAGGSRRGPREEVLFFEQGRRQLLLGRLQQDRASGEAGLLHASNQVARTDRESAV